MNNQKENSNELVAIENKYWKDLCIALGRLHENPDFQKVILEGYFKDRAVNGVSMLAHTSVIREGKRGEVYESLVAISHLQDFFITIANLGSSPEEDDDDNEIENTDNLVL